MSIYYYLFYYLNVKENKLWKKRKRQPKKWRKLGNGTTIKKHKYNQEQPEDDNITNQEQPKDDNITNQKQSVDDIANNELFFI